MKEGGVFALLRSISTRKENMYMRFYKGMSYAFKTAIWPVGDYAYYILDVESSDRRRGYVLFGYDRECEVNAASRIIVSRKIKGQWKDHIYKIPFVREGGRLVFDLSAFLKKNGLKYKLYKRYKLYDDVCGSGYGPMIYCKNGVITWESNWCSDSYEYTLSVDYVPGASCMKIEGRKVSGFRVERETTPADSKEILDYFMKTMEECQNLSFREFGEVLDQLELRKESYFLDIHFADGTTVTGNKVNWEN